MKYLITTAAVACALLVTGCSDSSSNRSSSDPAAQIRVTHASPDAPAVNVYIDEQLALEAVDFKQSSGLVDIADPDSISVEVRGLLPDGSEVSVLGPVDLPLTSGERTDVVAFDNLFDASGGINLQARVLDPVTVEDDIDDVRVSVMHAAPNVGAVDIYVTAPGDALENNSPIDADFGDAAGPVNLMPDTDYQIRITPDGTQTVVYESDTLSFAAGTELLVLAVENTYRVGDSPVTLVAAGADGALELLDVNMGAAVRVVHASADTPAVDVLVDGAEVLDAVPYPAASDYDDIVAPAGTYNVVVAADADNSIAPIDENLTLEKSASYTAIALGSFVDDNIGALLTEDDRRHLATAAKVEIVHASYQVAADIPVDIYLTSDGVIADADPAVSGLAFGETTDQLALSPGDYWITVTAAGDKSIVALDTGGTLNLAPQTNYTIIARDPTTEEVQGAPLIRAIILTD